MQLEPVTFSHIVIATAIFGLVVLYLDDLYKSPLGLAFDRFASWWVLGYRLLKRDHRSMSEVETNLMANWAAAHGIVLGAVVLAVFFMLE